ncbi:MAG: carbamoyl-phosphate synthase large subunit, partial [Actinobacteria bacterium]|nr:carbamoyl-phosphate synthase large subunit [Actinomycetota bacterium]
WFISGMKTIVDVQEDLRGRDLASLTGVEMRTAKQYGLSDPQIAYLCDSGEHEVRAFRKELGVLPTFKTVDTCAAEFEGLTSYYYKTYESENEVRPCDKPKAIILGAGPNRIGQGIEFDYCCVHASYALHDLGYETIMINCNPETVSTDYDTSDRLYFEPLTYEDVMDIIEAERPDGVVVTLGGQTPLKLAHALEREGVNIMGTKPEAIDLAEDRERFSSLLDELGIAYPEAGVANSYEEALDVAKRIGFPLLVRPSYVLGGRGMVIAYDTQYLEKYMAEAAKISPDHPVYLDRFLEGAIEVDVDALCDGEEVYVGGVLEHIEEAGIHSGDSACCLPPFSLSESIVEQLRSYTRSLALRIGVRGLLNIQFAVKDSTIYVIEVNPRASRTVPFVSKATGVSLAKAAAVIMAGRSIASLGLPPENRELSHYAVKEAVLPFGRFPGADVVLGPEMKSTGEVMGIGSNFPIAYAKAELAIDYSLPMKGTAFISVCDRDKRNIAPIARDLVKLGFEIVSTSGTAKALKALGIPVKRVNKIQEARPNIGDDIANGKISLIINTPFGQETRSDGYHLRSAAVRHGICYVTTMAGAMFIVPAIEAAQNGKLDVCALQDFDQWELKL